MKRCVVMQNLFFVTLGSKVTLINYLLHLCKPIQFLACFTGRISENQSCFFNPSSVKPLLIPRFSGLISSKGKLPRGDHYAPWWLGVSAVLHGGNATTQKEIIFSVANGDTVRKCSRSTHKFQSLAWVLWFARYSTDTAKTFWKILHVKHTNCA